MLFDVERTTVAGRPALTVRGELDIVTVPVFAAAVDTAITARPSALTIDLTRTTFMDSSGARQLARTAKQAASAAAYDWTGVKSAADVGAGAGALLAAIVAANPAVRGVLFDRPDVGQHHVTRSRDQ